MNPLFLPRHDQTENGGAARQSPQDSCTDQMLITNGISQEESVLSIALVISCFSALKNRWGGEARPVWPDYE
jgi:hypothetical protein